MAEEQKLPEEAKKASAKGSTSNGSIDFIRPPPKIAIIPPDTMERAIPLTREDAGFWFAYDKIWYYLKILDRNGATVRAKRKMRMKIAWYNTEGVLEGETQSETTGMHTNGYWFQSISPFQCGVFQLTFECTDVKNITPLVHRITVIPPESGESAPASGLTEQELLISPIKRRKHTPGSFVHLPWVERLDRTTPPLELQGQVVSITLPAALKAALLDNRETVSLQGEVKPLPHSPSCGHILSKITRSVKMPKENADESRDRLILSFEALLEPALLYPEERQEHARALQELSGQSLCDLYGPVFLLRLLVLMSHTPSLMSSEVEDPPSEATYSKRKRELGRKHDGAAATSLLKFIQDIITDMDENLDIYFN